MALETAQRKDKKDVITETMLKLSEVEMKLSQLRRSKTQVTEGSCCLIYTVKMRLALQGSLACCNSTTISYPQQCSGSTAACNKVLL
jgi:hypothetical protein